MNLLLKTCVEMLLFVITFVAGSAFHETDETDERLYAFATGFLVFMLALFVARA